MNSTRVKPPRWRALSSCLRLQEGRENDELGRIEKHSRNVKRKKSTYNINNRRACTAN